MAYYRSYVCESGHRTNSDFGSADTFENTVAKLRSKHLLACACCGSEKVKFELAAPRVNRGAAPEADSRQMAFVGPSFGSFEDVGAKLVETLRAIHEGDEPFRPLAGKAESSQMDALVKEKIIERVHPAGKPRTYDA